MINKETIRQMAAENHQEVISIRHHLHMNPELSFKEFQTAAFVAMKLRELGIPCTENVAGTGVVGFIQGKNDGRTVALRADMDALPIQEANDVPYRSRVSGVMHACGHDVHTSSLLGTAAILNRLKEHFSGSVKLIFQPGEEKLPGGASLMISEGVLEDPRPQSVIGQHVMPLIPAGKVGFRSGVYMASTDELYLKIKGKGGHGAMPHLNTDPVLITAHLLVAMQQIVSRNANPTMPSVLSFGKVIANGATNVIPDEVYVEGTFRTLSENWRRQAHERMLELSHQLVKSMGGSLDFEIRKGYPVLHNEEKLTARIRKYAEDFLGQENIEDLDIWMAAEDFAFYSQKADACFYRLGTGNAAKGITSSVHTPTFDIDENALMTGTGLMAWLTIRELTQE